MRRFWRWLTGRSRHNELAALLALLRAHGVERYRTPGLVLVFRNDMDPPGHALPMSEAVLEAANEIAGAPARGKREPTDDELLYGQDGYGLGVGKPTAEAAD